MITTERYKIFINSKDFEKILKLSIPEFNKSIPISYDCFYKTILKKCILDETIIILYKNNEPIGYFIINISNRKVFFSFSFIKIEERGNGYSHILRQNAIDIFKKSFDNLTVYCDPNNIASLKGLHFLLKKYNCNYKKSEIFLKNKKHEKYEIEKFN